MELSILKHLSDHGVGLLELRGSLKNFPLPDIIQLIGMGRRSGVLVISLNKEKEASIFFNSGEMTHAEYGSIQGPSVIYKLFKKQRGSFQFSSGVESSKRSINVDWMTIVMEAARRFDEDKKTRSEQKLSGEHESEVEEIENVDFADNVDTEEIKKKMHSLLKTRFGRKSKKIREELDKIVGNSDKLLEFCDKAEKYIFVFIDNRKAREVAEELRNIIRADSF